LRTPAFLTRLWLLAVRLIPRTFHTKEAAAAMRVTRLDDVRRAELARNLRSMLRPKAA